MDTTLETVGKGERKRKKKNLSNISAHYDYNFPNINRVRGIFSAKNLSGKIKSLAEPTVPLQGVR